MGYKVITYIAHERVFIIIGYFYKLMNYFKLMIGSLIH